MAFKWHEVNIHAMPTITEFASSFDVTPNTVRGWTAEFADHLSAAANPPKGQQREYTDADADVIALIGHMRQQNKPYEEIHAALAAGERRQWRPPDSAESRQDADTEPEEQTALITRLASTVARFEGELEAVKGERDYLRQQLENEREARIEAEKEAARLAGQLDEKQQSRRSFWDRLRGE